MPVKYYNYQYYQSGDYVVVSFIGLKGVPSENIVVDIKPATLTVTIATPDCDPSVKALTLYNTIDATGSSYKIFPSKVEIKLHKTDSSNWPCLEKTAETVLPSPSAPSVATANAFSTTRWDKFCKDNEEEVDTSGDNLFRVLYQGATPEQRRAMMKSMQQSNGRTLNMNWDEVKDKNFEEDAKD